MKIAVRPVMAASIVSFAVLLSMTTRSPAGDGQAAQKIRWDIVTVSVTGSSPPLIINAGGSASPLANDNSFIILTGSGTFVAPPGGDDRSDTVTGGGTWETFDALTNSTGSGTYQVTGLVQWEAAPGVQPADIVVDTIGTAATYTSGLAALRIAYSDGEDGVLILSCGGVPGTTPATPPDVFEGVTASKGFVDYWNRVNPFPAVFQNGTGGNFTNFHHVVH